MVKQDSVADEELVCLSVVYGVPVGSNLAGSVGTAWVESCVFVLGGATVRTFRKILLDRSEILVPCSKCWSTASSNLSVPVATTSAVNSA